MSLLIAVKVLGDLCFYFSVVGAFPLLFFRTGEFIGPALSCALGAGLAVWLEKKHPAARFAALILPAASLLFASDWRELLILLPAFLYAGIVIGRGYFALEYNEYREIFLRSAVIWGIVFVFCLMLDYIVQAAGDATVFDWMFMLRYGLMFGIIGVFLLRQLRLGVLDLRGNMAVNAAEMAVVALLIFLVSGGIRFLALETVGQGFELLCLLISGGIMGLTSFQSPDWNEEKEILETMADNRKGETLAVGMIPQETSAEIAAQAETVIHFPWWLVAALILLILLIVLWKMLRPFLKRPAAASKPSLSREEVPASRRKNGIFLSDREKIRRCYRDFLKQMRRRGMKIRSDQTSEEILSEAQKFVDEDSAVALRNLYICARYDEESEITAEQVRQARQALKELGRSVKR